MIPRCERFVLAAAMLTVVALAAPSRAAAPTLADCDARVADEPRDAAAYYCYVIAAQASGRFDDAIRRLEALQAVRPHVPRLRLNIAVLEHDLGRPAALESYRAAIEGLEKGDDVWGLVYAHSGIGALLDAWGRADEAAPHFDRSLEVARDAGVPMMLAHAQARAANFADGQMDYGTALRLYREAEDVAFPDGPPYLKSWILSGLGRVYWALGEQQRALAVYEREAEHLRALGHLYAEATVHYNIALVTQQLADRGQADPDLPQTLAEHALQVALASGNRKAEGIARQHLAGFLHGREALEEARRSLRALEGAASLEQILLARRSVAVYTFVLGPEHRDEAWSILEAAVADARAAGDRFSEARGLILVSSFRLLGGAPHEQVVEAFNEAIEAIENIRAGQREHSIRAKNFGEWTFLYARLADYLLSVLPYSAMPEDDLDLAFRTVEKMRARVLLDLLSNAGVSESGHLQATRPTFPGLREVRALLEQDQALLAFHLVNDPIDVDLGVPGGERRSWVLSITREGVTPIEIPERYAIEEQVSVYRGTFAARSGSDERPAVRLYDDLLVEALDSLPPGIERLVIVPDGVLHELPFETLRPRVGASPLATRFEIAYAPSVTLWARARQHPAAVPEAPAVLAFADPDLGVDAESTLREAGSGFAGLGTARLRHAPREARTLLRRLGGDGRVFGGAEATERVIKQADLSSYDVLHFAAHAVVDRARPERSAVVLAPGDPDEDGLLRMSEIAALDLDGQLVILSGCRSASGELVDGEGMVGLSRAFFVAGARTVVGSLWPLRDDEAADLVADFSRGLGSGRTVAGALAAARRERIVRGAPPAAWAGLVVLGDGDLVLTAEPRNARIWRWLLLPLLALIGLALWWRRRFV